MKKLLTLALILFVIPFAYSTAELFSGNVKGGEPFEAGDYSCSVSYSISNQRLVFQVDDWRRILIVGDCFQEQNVRACFDSVSVDDMGVVSSLMVSVYDLSPSLVIERTFSETTLDLGDEIEVITTIKNEGEKIAADIVYIDPFPAELKVIAGPREGNTVKWGGRLSGGDSTTIKYELQALGITTYESKAKATYISSGEVKTKTVSETIEVIRPYEFKTGLSLETPKKGELVLFNITIDNTGGTEKLTISDLLIEPSQHVEIVDFSESFEKKLDTLSYSGSVAAEAKKNFWVYVKSSRVGEHSIKTTATTKIGYLKFTEESVEEFSIGLSKISALMDISPKTVKAGDDIKLNVDLKNTAEEEIKGISIKIESPLFGAIEEYNKKVYAESKDEGAVTKTIIAPDVNEEATYAIKLIGYYTKNQQTFTFKAEDEVKVTPQQKIIQLLHEKDKEEFNRGEKVTVDVSIVNLQNIDLEKVSLIEILPSEVKSSLEGVITDDVPLGANEKKKVYSYSFTVPKDYDKDTLDIRTIINTNFEGSLYKYDILHPINVTGEKEENEGAEESEQERNITAGEDAPEKGQEEEKISLFKKILNFLKRLFTRSQPGEQE